MVAALQPQLERVGTLLGRAAVVESYTYLLSRNITTHEAIRRLRLLRAAAGWAALCGLAALAWWIAA